MWVRALRVIPRVSKDEWDALVHNMMIRGLNAIYLADQNGTKSLPLSEGKLDPNRRYIVNVGSVDFPHSPHSPHFPY